MGNFGKLVPNFNYTKWQAFRHPSQVLSLSAHKAEAQCASAPRPVASASTSTARASLTNRCSFRQSLRTDTKLSQTLSKRIAERKSLRCVAEQAMPSTQEERDAQFKRDMERTADIIDAERLEQKFADTRKYKPFADSGRIGPP